MHENHVENELPIQLSAFIFRPLSAKVLHRDEAQAWGWKIARNDRTLADRHLKLTVVYGL